MMRFSPFQKFAGLVLLITLPVFLASCSVGRSGKTPSANDSTSESPEYGFNMGSQKDDGTVINEVVQEKITNIADGLTERLIAQATPSKDFRIIMASFVNLDDMESTSQFGRMISEELLTALNQRGFNVIEVRIGRDLIIEQKKGEFLLSRKVKELTTRYNANSFVVGTYSVLKNKTIFLNTRLVRAADMEVFAASKEYISLAEHPSFRQMLMQDSAIEKSNARWNKVEKK